MEDKKKSTGFQLRPRSDMKIIGNFVSELAQPNNVMRTLPALIVAFLLAIPAVSAGDRQLDVKASVWFSPNGGCTEAICHELASAKQTILVQAYSFTSAPIAKALVDAYKRGVKVQVILDKSQKTEKYSSATFLANQGVPVKIDSKHAIAHNKVMVIDGETIITGSFNFTKSAEGKNAENVLILRSKALADEYVRNWQEHAGHSEEYVKTEGK